MQELAGRWQSLIDAFTGGDPGIFKSLQRMYQEQWPKKASRGMVIPGRCPTCSRRSRSAPRRTSRGPPRGGPPPYGPSREKTSPCLRTSAYGPANVTGRYQ